MFSWIAIGLIAPASADCAHPLPWFSSQASSAPEDPTLWFFLPLDLPIDVSFSALDRSGLAVPISATRQPGAGGLQVWRLALDTTGTGKVTVEARWGDDQQDAAATAVRIQSVWHAPTRTTPRIEDAGVTRTAWMCSFQESRDLRIAAPGAVALELVWADSLDAWNAGDRQRAVFPDHPGRLWGQGAPEPRIELGHLSCFGETFDWDRAEVWIGVRALTLDGRDGEISAPIRVRAP